MQREDQRTYERAQRYLASHIAQARARLGWSQQRTAEESGLDPKHVQKLEYGELNPTLKTITRLAGAFHVRLVQLLAPTRVPPPRRPVGRPRARRAARG